MNRRALFRSLATSVLGAAAAIYSPSLGPKALPKPDGIPLVVASGLKLSDFGMASDLPYVVFDQDGVPQRFGGGWFEGAVLEAKADFDRELDR